MKEKKLLGKEKEYVEQPYVILALSNYVFLGNQAKMLLIAQ